MKNKNLVLIGLSAALIAGATIGTLPSKVSATSTAAVQTIYQDWTDSKRNRTLPVKIYMPQLKGAHFPVVVFSHGLGGSREAAIYLGNYWAEQGYVAVFIQHPGSDESFWKPNAIAGVTTRESLMPEFRKTVANPVHAINRAQDVHFVIDRLTELNTSDKELAGKLNMDALAIAGHSYGSWTALTASGQNLFTPNGRSISSPDSRIKAAIYLSPTAPRKKQNASAVYSDIKIPGLHFTGTEDSSPVNDTTAGERRIAYDNIKKSDQYLIILDGADHMVFNGGRRLTPKAIDQKHHEIIEMASTKFLDAYLKKDSAALAWLKGAGARDQLKGNGTYELKAAK